MKPSKADVHLPHALRILARDIHCEDGIATQCIREAADEIERLRLTDAEREAVEAAVDSFASGADFNDQRGWPATAQRLRERAAALRGLLARMSGNGDCPAPDKTAERDNSDRSQPIAKCDATPNTPSTPDECSVPPEWTSRPYYVDPPSGWQYGFPKLYDPAKDGDMRAWMIANGYPKKLANLGLPCTFTFCAEDGVK